MSQETEAEIAKAVENPIEIFDPLAVLLDEVVENPSPPYRPELLAELAALKQDDEAAFEATLSMLKDAGVKVAALNKAIFNFLKMDKPDRTQADAILRIANDFELFHSPDKTAYADVAVDGHRETYPIVSKAFEQLLKQRLYMATAEAATPEAVRKVKDLLEARAQYEGPTREVYVRVGSLDGALYVDLGDDDWNVVEITRDGWQVVQNSPVRFCRFPGMQPLPVPQRGGSIETLRRYLNVSGDEDFVLLVSWILGALRHGGPYPVMVLFGEQGTAKSTTCKILRSLVDPNSAPVRTIPREERDLFVSAKHSHVLAFDNLSSLPQWLSDGLCRLATGGGHAARRVYTDDDEILFDAQRPVILNGIEQMVTRADLADRAMFISLEPIRSKHRVSERELLASFENDRAIIFGALLEMMVCGLRELSDIKPRELSRMADFQTWVMACEGAEWQTGTFERASKINREDAVETVLETDAVAVCVKELVVRTMRTMRTQDSTRGRVYDVWSGTASELLAKLKEIATANLERDRDWPKTAGALSSRLKRVIPFLRECGIEIITGKKKGHGRKRMIYITVIENGGNQSSAPSASSAREIDRPRSDADADFPLEESEAVEPEESADAPSLSATSLAAELGSAEAGGTTNVKPPERKPIVIKRPKKKV